MIEKLERAIDAIRSGDDSSKVAAEIMAVFLPLLVQDGFAANVAYPAPLMDASDEQSLRKYDSRYKFWRMEKPGDFIKFNLRDFDEFKVREASRKFRARVKKSSGVDIVFVTEVTGNHLIIKRVK